MTCVRRETILPVGTLPQLGFPGEMLMVLPSSEGIDLLWPCGVQNSGPLHFRMGSQPQNGYRDQTARVTANSKNVSFYGWNIIPCSKATRVATSAQRL